MEQSYRAIVAGATGLVGRELIAQLTRSPHYEKVWALTRRPAEFDSPAPEQLVIDFDRIPESLPDVQADHLFCALGTTINKAGTREEFRKVDQHYVIALGRWAKEHGINKFLAVSAMGASERSLFFYNRVKGQTEAGLKELGLPSLFIFRPSLLLGKRNKKRPAEETAEKIFRVLNPLMAGPLKKYKPVEAGTVAAAMISEAINSDEPFKIILSYEMEQTV
ncbi:MAG: hypothetical protein Kow00127_12790 [Bacteroidales bacterium]